MNTINVKPAHKLTIALALAVIALAVLVVTLSPQPTRAQGGEIYVNKQLGRTDPVVHVGEYLTFTIFIRNDSTFTITTLPMSDTYNTAVLGYADASVPPDSVDTGTGRIDWNDLTTFFGNLAPGDQATVIVGFIAEHPQAAVVNAAEVHDALHAGGALSGTISTHAGGEAIGGSSPLDKQLMAGLAPQVGQPLTFTIVITNEGFTTMTLAPLMDNYNPAWMAFNYAVPPPDQTTPAGTLIWTDLTGYFGDVPPHGTLSVMTVFTALMAVDGGANHAEVSGATDWYGNDLTGGGDDVPIIIIAAPATPTPTRRPRATSVPAAPTPTPVPTLAPTPTVIVLLLPATGQSLDAKIAITTVGLLALVFILGVGTARYALQRD